MGEYEMIRMRGRTARDTIPEPHAGSKEGWEGRDGLRRVEERAHSVWGREDAWVLTLRQAIRDRRHRRAETRWARIVRGALSAPTDEAPMASAGKELDDRIAPLRTAEERQDIYR